MNMNIEELLKGININQVNNQCGSVSAVNINNYGGTAAAAPSTPQQPVATHFPADYQSRAFVSNVGGIAVSLDAIRSMIAQLIVSKLITKKYHWAAVQLALEEMGLCCDNSSLLADELNSQYWFPELEEDIKPNKRCRVMSPSSRNTTTWRTAKGYTGIKGRTRSPSQGWSRSLLLSSISKRLTASTSSRDRGSIFVFSATF